MLDRSNVIYRCDGSFDGLLCCVFESFSQKERPLAVWGGGEEEDQLTLCPVREIPTEMGKAERVKRSIPLKLGNPAKERVEHAFLSGEPDRLLAILNFLHTAYRIGPRAALMLDLPEVAHIFSLERAVLGEAHLLTGFVRFSEIAGVLTAEISPKNFVLPLLAPHFCGRFCEERFLIYDKTHGAALFYRPYEAQLLPIEHFSPAAPDEAELRFQTMWQDYYHAIAITARENPRCRMGHMPKRYWQHMTEMSQQAALPGKRQPLPALTQGALSSLRA